MRRTSPSERWISWCTRGSTQIVLQIVLGTLVPLALLGLSQLRRFSARRRMQIYVAAAVLTFVGIFAMRWNVVIGGQLFSKSFLGYTTYKMGFATREGLLPAIFLLVLPFVLLAGLIRLLPPWPAGQPQRAAGHPDSG
jgi:Ni/Fe-hydrogenase subunit HybB-like protein